MARLNQVQVGDVWTVKISDKVVQCRVLEIKPKRICSTRKRVRLLNLTTKREVCRTAAALRRKH